MASPGTSSRYLCPISHEPMLNPTSLETGVVYDLSRIKRWFEAGSNTCPCTRTPVDPTALTPLPELAAEIRAWLQQQDTKPSTACPPLDPCEAAAVQLVTLATAAQHDQLHALQRLLHIAHLPARQSITRSAMVTAGAVPLLAHALLASPCDMARVHCADLLSLLSAHPGVDVAMTDAANDSGLLPQRIPSLQTTRLDRTAAKALAGVVVDLDKAQGDATTRVWLLWLLTPWDHVRRYLLQRTKVLTVLRNRVALALGGKDPNRASCLTATCHLLRSMALVPSGAEAMLSNGTLGTLRLALQTASTPALRIAIGSALSNACFVLRRADKRLLLGADHHQRFALSLAANGGVLQALQGMLAARDDVLGVRTACALLHSITTNKTIGTLIVHGGLGPTLVAGCACDDEVRTGMEETNGNTHRCTHQVVQVICARALLSVASVVGEEDGASLASHGAIPAAASLLPAHSAEASTMGAQLLLHLHCRATVDQYMAPSVWGALLLLIGSMGDVEAVHAGVQVLLKVLQACPRAAAMLRYEDAPALRTLLLQLESVHGGADAQRAAAEVLTLLADDAHARALVRKVGAPHALVATLRRASHMQLVAARDGTLAQHCLRALRSLAVAGGACLEEVLSACESDRHLRALLSKLAARRGGSKDERDGGMEAMCSWEVGC